MIETMNFRVSCQLKYNLKSPATFFFAVKGIASGGQQIFCESLVSEPYVSAEEFSITGGMSRITRIMTLDPGILRLSYKADVRTSILSVAVASISHEASANLNPDVTCRTAYRSGYSPNYGLSYYYAVGFRPVRRVGP